MPLPLNPARRSLLAVAAGAIGLLILIAWISSIGGPHDPLAGLTSILYVLIHAGPPALAYLLGAIGLGMLLSPWTKNARDPIALQCGLGLALMLSLSHGLGCLGLLSGSKGVILGGGLVLIGIIALARRIAHAVKSSSTAITVPWTIVLSLPGLAVLLVAACNTPGWLWTGTHADPIGEARGYDALSYHLQLPQEWLADGRIFPRVHNVYSFLPSYMESAFYHLGAMLGVPTTGAAQSRAMGLLAGDGMGVVSCQLLHAGTAIFSAILIARLVKSLIRDVARSSEIAALIGAMFISIPWVIVTGSLAYNEMPMLALTAAAVIAACDPGLSPTRRGLLSGFLLGVACGCKPTALFLCGPVVGFMLLFARGAPLSIGAASLGGAVAIAPWLIRNWCAIRNPVFPMASRYFSTGLWHPEQFQRYAAGHHFDGSLADRFLVLLSSDRGLAHAQWSVLPIIAIVGCIAAALTKPTRRPAIAFALGGLAQIIAWMMLTHLQSRFLLPLAITGCALVGLGLAAIGGRIRGLILGAGAMACLVHAGMTIGIFSGQSNGKPNAVLLESPSLWTGELDREILKRDPQRAQTLAEEAAPSVFVNVFAPPGTGVYLLGGATPLYFTGPVLYNTTWDRWPLGEAMRRSPGKPSDWTRALWAQGIRLVLVEESEIERLQRSGYADPLVTSEAVSAWLKEEGRLVRSWPGTALFELRPPGSADGT